MYVYLSHVEDNYQVMDFTTILSRQTCDLYDHHDNSLDVQNDILLDK